MTQDPLDQPEDDAMELAVPFIVCQSQGGPFDDDAFVAGFQAGVVDQALKSGAVAQAATVRFPMVRTVLLKQLELIGMNRGYPIMASWPSEEFPEWTDVTFGVEGLGSDDDQTD